MTSRANRKGTHSLRLRLHEQQATILTAAQFTFTVLSSGHPLHTGCWLLIPVTEGINLESRLPAPGIRPGLPARILTPTYELKLLSWVHWVTVELHPITWICLRVRLCVQAREFDSVKHAEENLKTADHPSVRRAQISGVYDEVIEESNVETIEFNPYDEIADIDIDQHQMPQTVR